MSSEKEEDKGKVSVWLYKIHRTVLDKCPWAQQLKRHKLSVGSCMEVVLEWFN